MSPITRITSILYTSNVYNVQLTPKLCAFVLTYIHSLIYEINKQAINQTLFFFFSTIMLPKKYSFLYILVTLNF